MGVDLGCVVDAWQCDRGGLLCDRQSLPESHTAGEVDEISGDQSAIASIFGGTSR